MMNISSIILNSRFKFLVMKPVEIQTTEALINSARLIK